MKFGDIIQFGDRVGFVVHTEYCWPHDPYDEVLVLNCFDVTTGTIFKVFEWMAKLI